MRAKVFRDGPCPVVRYYLHAPHVRWLRAFFFFFWKRDDTNGSRRVSIERFSRVPIFRTIFPLFDTGFAARSSVSTRSFRRAPVVSLSTVCRSIAPWRERCTYKIHPDRRTDDIAFYRVFPDTRRGATLPSVRSCDHLVSRVKKSTSTGAFSTPSTTVYDVTILFSLKIVNPF